MRVVVQRVSRASVKIGDRDVAAIGRGLVLLVGFTTGDLTGAVDWMTDKIAGLRIFSDDEGKMNRSLDDVGGAVLVVSQFTLYGDVQKGRRPSFVHAARPDHAAALYNRFVSRLRATGLAVETGEFGAAMEVSLVNDGPVTLVIDR